MPLIVDNTLATPYLCRPKEFGADIIVHSLTKFLGGHGNSIGGAIVDCGTYDWLGAKHRYSTLVEPNPSYNGMRLAETFGNFAFAIACRVMGLRDLGPALSPFNAFLILTGIETLPLRMAKHCENALAVAKHLAKHPQVEWVNYAGLPKDKSHAIAKKICPKGAGSVFTFGLKGGYDAGVRLVSSVKLFSHLANIGDVRSLIIHPGIDYASPAHRRAEDSGRCRPRRGTPLDRARGCRRHHRRLGSGLGGRVSSQQRGVRPARISANNSRSMLPPLRISPTRLPRIRSCSCMRAASGPRLRLPPGCACPRSRRERPRRSPLR